MNDALISYKRHRFPAEIIAQAVWLYYRFPLSLRLVEEMLLERGIVVSYETVRRWGKKFGPEYVTDGAGSGPAPMMFGTWTKFSSLSPARNIGCGGLSTRMDMFSMRSSRSAAIPRPPSACSPGC